MAQFSHPEFGGSGQWMSGGMLMLGDMFDHELKRRVNALCMELSTELPELAGSIESPGCWWPSGLGTPSATGSQGSMRYAYFGNASRLAVDAGGTIRVHDTLDHRIGGFSQRQGASGRLSMSSQHGTVDLATLPVVSEGDDSRSPPTDRQETFARSATPSTDDPLRLIERLGQLHQQGLLTEQEFTAKKLELLERL